MNGKTDHRGVGMTCMKTLAMLALVAGAGLWSGCDQSDEMSALARSILPGRNTLDVTKSVYGTSDDNSKAIEEENFKHVEYKADRTKEPEVGKPYHVSPFDN